MNKAGGFITLHRQIMDWEWYKDTNTAFLFIHLLLSANFTDTKFKGRIIKRGQIVTSFPSLSTDTGLSIQQTRTALSHLISTGEVTDEVSHNYRVITVVKYDDYQSLTDKPTDNQQATNRQINSQSTDDLTVNQQHHNNVNNNNKETNKQRNKENDIDHSGFDTFWQAYPRKVGKSAAIRAFAKIRPDETMLQEMLKAINQQKTTAQWQENGGQFIPHPSTWLNGRRWEDEVQAAPARPSGSASRPVVAQTYEQREYETGKERPEDMLRRLFDDMGM